MLLPEMSGLKSRKMMDDDGAWRHYLRLHMLSRSYTPRMIHNVDGLHLRFCLLGGDSDGSGGILESPGDMPTPPQ